MNDQSRLISAVSYITIVGWVIALILRQNENPKSELGLFHLRQSFGTLILFFIASFAKIMLATIGLSWLGNVVGLVVLVLWLIGLIGAIQGRFTKVPFVGDWFQENFRFIA
ncbi:hypothetical protein KEM09_09370 [Carboxylicivirga mesophila]|uniref:Import component protein n=1 Tax=Carboxylicivirga mesophila TaxID=1166478 RepID=A0ABS5K9E0_9BACT|nr:hypothetical protein [Carboxylicivirga mesophila]MBS2211611.1 hypothetical protein [Carboxylicivirga mesophila]